MIPKLVGVFVVFALMSVGVCASPVGAEPADQPVTTTEIEPMGSHRWSIRTTFHRRPAGLVSSTTFVQKQPTTMPDPRSVPPSHRPKPVRETSARECPQWLSLATAVGWPDDQLARLSYVMYRESRCDPNALNSADPTRMGSLGLNQINGFWCLPSRYWQDGWLQAHGLLEDCEELYDPRTNLASALAIWENSGWRPWGYRQ